jgi:hypothetical protein
MLVVADQLALGIGRQGGLAGAGQAEEDRAVAVSPSLTEQCIGMMRFSGSR